MRKPLIVANWKMNHGVEDSLKFITRMQKELFLTDTVENVICPPHTSLYSLSVALSEQPCSKLGAQNCYHALHGAYTGETSPLFLKELGCEYVIVGHSERRTLFGETNELLNKKINTLVECGLIPIYCVGETLSQRTQNKTFEVLEEQLKSGLSEIPKEMEKLVIAYEPVWAIGTGQNASDTQAEEVHSFIRKWLGQSLGANFQKSTRIIYGGSVKTDNIRTFMKKENIDGALVGGASLDVDSFIKIINYQYN